MIQYRKNDFQSKYRASLSFAAIGDALGWPVEYGNKKSVSDFVDWKKFVGGRFYGYEQEIEKGMYSDDMQLTLSVARSIDYSGFFDPGFFAYLELPLWLSYEQGGGRATKTAAHSLARGENWESNYYFKKSGKKDPPVSYVNAGGNGVVMRILPNILTQWRNQDALIEDIFNNAIITHGHLRAIYGSFLYALAAKFILENSEFSVSDFFDYLTYAIQDVCLCKFLPNLRAEIYLPWIVKWEAISNLDFQVAEQKVVSEVVHLLEEAVSFLDHDDREFFEHVGALNRETRGSGTITATVAIYMFIKYFYEPSDGLLKIVNMFGSDTDTNANIACSLWGLAHGWSCIENGLSHMHDQLQDKEYLLNVADQLHGYLINEKQNWISREAQKEESLIRVLAWEIGLHDMFWDAIEIGKRIIHPVLGSGTVSDKTEKPLRNKGYTAKLIRVIFETGQTCWFHSRMNLDGSVVNSLHKELRIALRDSELLKMRIFEIVESMVD